MSTDPSSAGGAGAGEAAGHPVGDRPARQRFIARSAWYTIPGTIAVLVAAPALAPPMTGVADAGQRLTLALGWLLVALAPYVLVCLVIAALRFVEGSHDPLAGAESERLKVHCRVMQNTLEQPVWFAFALLALAAFASAREARLVPVACILFAFARLVYWWGYLRRGTLGRAPGVQLTFTLNIAVSVYAMVLFVRG